MRIALRSAFPFIAIAVLGTAIPASAQDHEKCYKISDPARIKGVVDLITPQFGLEPGCILGTAKYFCAPAYKQVIGATSAGTPITPLPLYAPTATVDRICYKVKCPIPPPPFPPDQNVTDQFGNRTLAKFKASFVCTPAVKGPGYCGDGIINGGEVCDGAATGSCPGTCQPDCTCTCPTACCYVENLAAPPAAECFEYSGSPAQVAAFQAACTNGGTVGVVGSTPNGSMVNSNVGSPTFMTAPCLGSTSPLYGTPCIPGGPGAGNLHVIPSDSSCP